MTQGITLIINAAEGLLQTAALRDGVRLFAQEWLAPTRGTEILAPALADAFGRLRIGMDQVKRIACVRGPGGFTGLRLALSTAAGMARCCGAQQAGLDYMHALADRPFVGPGDVLWVLTHARRGLVHAQGFTVPAVGALPVPFCPVEAVTVEQIAERMALHGDAPVVLGSGLSRNRTFFAERLSSAHLMPAEHDHPTMQALVRLTEAATWGTHDIEPFYLRPCDAVENLSAIAAKRGMAPAEAQQELDRLTSQLVP